jgi:hypothetical protein
MDLPEEPNMFKEKLELERTKDESDDPFEPAKLTKMNPSEALAYFEL